MIPRRFSFIHEHRQHWPIRLQCKVLAVSVSGYYDWREHKSSSPGPRARRRAELTVRVREIHQAHRRCYGSPRIFQKLKFDGQKVSRKTVAAIMREQQIQGKSPRRRTPRTTDSRHGCLVASNVLERDFTATTVNRKWVADITCIPTGEGWLYLAVVLDCFSRRIVGWSTGDHMRSDLVASALRSAIHSRKPGSGSGLIHHSDRGSQYASASYQQLLSRHGVICSMSRKGNCWDNAMAESFFGTLKTELHERLSTRQAARSALFEYIEVFYNRQRLHSALGYQSPAAYEQKHQAA
jgi:transposase InsO family protein